MGVGVDRRCVKIERGGGRVLCNFNKVGPIDSKPKPRPWCCIPYGSYYCKVRNVAKAEKTEVVAQDILGGSTRFRSRA